MSHAAVFNIVRDQYNFVPINLVLGGGAAFIAYGRLFGETHRAKVEQHLPHT
jgi:hypothetical protein